MRFPTDAYSTTSGDMCWVYALQKVFLQLRSGLPALATGLICSKQMHAGLSVRILCWRSCTAGSKLPLASSDYCMQDMPCVLGVTCCRTQAFTQCALGWHNMHVLGCCAAGNKLSYSCSMTASTDPCWGHTLKEISSHTVALVTGSPDPCMHFRRKA